VSYEDFIESFELIAMESGVITKRGKVALKDVRAQKFPRTDFF